MLSSSRAAEVLTVGQAQATMTVTRDGDLRTYQLTTTAELRDNRPPEKQITFSEDAGHATIRTGSFLFDGLYAMAVNEARLNSVSHISDDAYAHGQPLRIDAFQTGEFWKYVWTRDLSYSLDLGLAGFDPARATSSLLFKSSGLKPSVNGGAPQQIVQDTGSGGSYPISTDRVVWVLGADAILRQLSGAERTAFLQRIYPILQGTIEQDYHLVLDPSDGLYRGEQSFLDWREQTYPGWTKDSVLPIGVSKSLTTNVAHYLLLMRAAEYAGLLDKTEEESRYRRLGGGLRDAINARFWDPEGGLYCAYLLSDDGVSDQVRVSRYDLLGESLAVLSGVADEKQIASVLTHYPTGPFGPPVVWPQERTVPIYHNQAIWPFVTAYWTRAARLAGSAQAVDAGIESLKNLAALNLSNMENFDFVTGSPQVKTGPRQGPVISSRRQLWSVAAYLSMVQDVVFGQEISLEGIRFRPCITAKLRNTTFRSTDTLEWRSLAYQGTRHRVRVHLPPVGSGGCAVDRVELNGKPVDATDYVKDNALQPDNIWEIFLKPSGQNPTDTLRVADPTDERAICAPVQPEWTSDGQNGITVVDDRVTLHFSHPDVANVEFTIFRDGQPFARHVRETRWKDPDSGNYRAHIHIYRVAAADFRTGLVSHLTPGRAFRLPEAALVIPAASMRHDGSDLDDKQHLVRWGRPEQELTVDLPVRDKAGTWMVRAEFANGAGPVNTGITCAVKRLEVKRADSGEVMAAGYLVMPQSGRWNRFELSSAVKVDLLPGVKYVLRISEDEWCRNMSYLQSNARYTSANGGGDTSYNLVDLAALHLLQLGASQ